MAFVRTDAPYWAKYFEGTNFGTDDYPGLIYEALMKTACGYYSGYTIECILLRSHMAMPRRSGRGIELTINGERTLYAFYTESLAAAKR